MIWVIFAGLIGAAVFAVLWPLSRAPAKTDARELDVAFYKAQAAEIDRDEARGVIAASEATSARSEAARRLVSASQRPVVDVEGSSRYLTLGVALGVIAFVPALALGLYMQVGEPNMPDEPLQARLDAPAGKMDMATAIARIEDHLAKDPSDARGWAVIAPIYVRLQRYDDAKQAYTNEIRLLGPDAVRLSGLGQVEMALNGGMVTVDARKDFEQAAALDPKNPGAEFYLGLAAQQDGDRDKAGTIWRKLVADSPPDAPWVPTVQQHIAALDGASAPMDSPAMATAQGPAGAPSGDMAGKMAAVRAMPQDQQQAMIHMMVDRLATRLKTNGNDIEGWLRLVRAYRVLDEQDKAKVALGDAKRTFASDPGAVKRLDDLAHELGLEG